MHVVANVDNWSLGSFMDLEDLMTGKVTLLGVEMAEECGGSLPTGVEEGVVADVIVVFQSLLQIRRQVIVCGAQIGKVSVAALAWWGNLVCA
jgi:hypothetical protein